mmetsp:Transcript_1610/g.2431  ORF Transcript_1610/g.2431 Transcript_1610/m.2431 type:complete len:397 (+) Transcript_1610:196-1386(+)|eukprot:CAMPEP_0184650852 /NCGR_PEP_ID=MMETSP0308-20130426/8427_1 /TAXON_ID=38269 /ORGANISM="Gloeochaete witrockiana, Strain SAG 46.84" /LENGTH=396 /DNA_ID=CAMNT_0027084675 /DNA_START=123 /DNA_END=1313 /DNA_ORIENTATION=-
MAIKLANNLNNDLLYIGFNQDFGCFAVGTNSGFRIYNCDPYKETFRRDFPNGGIGVVEMLFRCNILALVGGGKNPRYLPTKVMIWDDHQSRCIGELSFRNEVKAVKLRRDRIVVVLEQKIYVYNFSDLKLLHQIETVPNPKGLCALCPNSTNICLVCPGLHRGDVRVELYDLKKSHVIRAHDSALAAIALNLDGTRLATASEKGTLIRIFDTITTQQLQEVRRGTDRAEIYSIAFNQDSSMLCASSDRGTCHIFGLANPSGETNGESGRPSSSSSVPASTAPLATSSAIMGTSPSSSNSSTTLTTKEQAQNVRSSLSFMGGMLPKYFSSQWSFAQFRLPAGKNPADIKTICAFGAARNTLIVVSSDASFYKVTFDVKTGECKQEHYFKFIKPPNEV